MKPTNKIEWQGHTIGFIPVLSHKYFWIATENVLLFDGVKVATSGGLGFSSQARATVHHDGRPIVIEMRSSSRYQALINLNYELLIDGQVISRGIAKTSARW